MKMLWLLLSIVILQGGASAQVVNNNLSQSRLIVSNVTWTGNMVVTRQSSTINGNPASLSNRRNQLYGNTTTTQGFQMRTMSVTVKNSGTVAIESLRLAFVFSDPETGKEWFRYRVHSKKRVLPGESRVIETSAVATLGSPPRDQLADKSAVITEVRFADGSIWQHK